MKGGDPVFPGSGGEGTSSHFLDRGVGYPHSFFGEGEGIPPLTFWTGYHPPLLVCLKEWSFRRDSTGSCGRVHATGGGWGPVLRETGGWGTSSWGLERGGPPHIRTEDYSEKHLKKRVSPPPAGGRSAASAGPRWASDAGRPFGAAGNITISDPVNPLFVAIIRSFRGRGLVLTI